MSDTKKTPSAPAKTLKLPMLLTAALVLTSCSGSEQAAIGTCEKAGTTAKAIAPMVSGDLAAFSILQSPQKMPDLAFLDGNGAPVTLAAFSGKTILFNLWATWCAPCRKEMPAFDALQEEFGGEKFEIVPVSVDRGGPDKPRAFYQEIGLKHLPFYQDETMGVFNTLKKQSLAFGLPVSILVDEAGCILGSLHGPAEWAGEDAKTLIRATLQAEKK